MGNESGKEDEIQKELRQVAIRVRAMDIARWCLVFNERVRQILQWTPI